MLSRINAARASAARNLATSIPLTNSLKLLQTQSKLSNARPAPSAQLNATTVQQQAFISFLRSKETTTLRKVIAEAQSSLGENTPLTTSVKGMKTLLDSRHFKRLLDKNSSKLLEFAYSDPNNKLVDMANDVIKHKAPNPHPNSSQYPVPLPFRGLVISLLGGLICENGGKVEVVEDGEKYSAVQVIAEINGLIEAALNIHRNITQSSQDKISNNMNKMAVLGGDYCLAKACQLLSKLSSPEAVEKISFTLSAISQRASGDVEHSNLLLKSCCETLVILEQVSEKGNSKSFEENQNHISTSISSKINQVSKFSENLNSAHTALLNDNVDMALYYKFECIKFLRNYKIDEKIEMSAVTENVDLSTELSKQYQSSAVPGLSSEQCRHLLVNLVEAFLPVERKK